MTYLDSNVLIRIITGDMPEVANRLLDQISGSKKNEYVVTESVLAEVCFVLEFHDYAMKRQDIHDALSDIINSSQINCSPEAAQALLLYQKHNKLDFTDCYLLAIARNNHAKILTLDKELQKQTQSRAY